MSKIQIDHTTHEHTDSEIMRIIASFFVIMIHASGLGSVGAIVFNSVSRFSVPVFIILSGYYMLAKSPNWKRLARKCGHLFARMLVWSALYLSYDLLSGAQSDFVFSHLARYLLTEPVHLWYIYAAIALYMITPILCVFHHHASKKEYLYALLLTFFFGSWIVILVRSDILPIVSVLLEQMKFPYTLGFICLYLLGGYLSKYPIQQRTHRTWLYIWGIIGIAATIVGTWLLPRYGFAGDLLISFFAPNVIITAAAFFVFFKQHYLSHTIRSGKIKNIVHNIAQCSMGVYFLHPMILAIICHKVEPMLFSSVSWILIPQRVLTTWIISVCLVFLCKKVPLLKRLF